ncbi:aromatic ring-hydroxylating dioxygenase subunit alpha [Comamonas sp. Tr-654]|uniref:aromatic ring-hydroxylating dioxygenase subunit alpha n=1 Tax=Comamonas sp. Tr-654 TaxID=2608341 RepID=UPI00142403A2|nr:aromatic ring-hydroxylating dioxygenase subunit alpha [Comamonas sp. Tr-654]NIF82693.1 aromatic ring-hydroxylating dioxygenase subunit alpha [Comamonas sp. Tr-654]
MTQYLRNVWYVAAWDTEVPVGKILARTILGERIAIFRDETGNVSALFDRCPHRFAPLSMGKVVGGCVQCPYHGLEFRGDGSCNRNPHGNGQIPKAAQVRSYPMVERWSALWIWMGDPSKADAELIPEFKSLDPEKRWVGKDYLLAKAEYQLETDNILDLSHIEYLHPGTLGSDAVKQSQSEVKQEGDTVYSLRLTRNEQLMPSLAQRYGIAEEQLVDRWLDTRWNAPAVMELWVGVAPAGSADPRAVGKQVPFAHLFTPETATTAHYWFATSYPKRMGEEGRVRAESDIRYLREPFEREDLPMLEAQQQSLGDNDFWSLKPILLPGDAAAVRTRRVLDALIKAEQEAKAAEEVRA